MRFYFLLMLLWGWQFTYAQQDGFSLGTEKTSPHPAIHEVQTLIEQTFPELQRQASFLEFESVSHSPVADYYRFQQTFQNKPIYAAGITVKVDHSGRVIYLDHLAKGFESSPSRAHDFLLDQADMHTEFMNREQARAGSMEQSYLLQNNKLIPVYRAITLDHIAGESFEYVLDASDGHVITREDRVAHFTGDTTGKGRVFLPNPCTVSGLPYGQPLADNNDQHTSFFEPYIDTVELQDLRFENGTFYLEGPYIRIEDFAANTVAPVTSSDGTFYFNRDESGFEDVMCYYHLDSYQRYIQSLGYTNLWGTIPLGVDPHGMGNADNSGFIPNGNNSTLRFGEGGVDDAEDGDVIIHEYGHALSYAAAPDTRIGTLRKGLDEGFGDYFSAGYSYDLRNDYGWELMMNWDGHNEFWGGRNSAISIAFDPSLTNIWQLGEIWASTMMQIRQSIGASKADQLQLEALYGSFSNMTFEDAAWLVIDADTTLFNGVHTPTLKQYFCQRNILNGAACNSVGIQDDFEEFAHKWEVFPIPNSGKFTARWKDERSPNPQQNIVLYNSMGQEIQRKSWGGAFETSFDLSLSPGLYILCLEEGQQLLARKKIAVW